MAGRIKWALGVWALLTMGVVWTSGTASAETVSGNSVSTTWTCTGTPCPWGPSTNNPAIVWPGSVSPTAQRLGYTASSAVYAPLRPCSA